MYSLGCADRHDVYELWEPNVGSHFVTCRKPYRMTPEHEKIFSLLCVIERMGNAARRQPPDKLLLTCYKIHAQVRDVMREVGPQAKMTLRVRSAAEQIIVASMSGLAANDPYKAIELVLAAAVWGTGKSKLLRAVTDQTWREQCAGRATLALRRDYPEFRID